MCFQRVKANTKYTRMWLSSTACAVHYRTDIENAANSGRWDSIRSSTDDKVITHVNAVVYRSINKSVTPVVIA